jgi:hypothetical protein
MRLLVIGLILFISWCSMAAEQSIKGLVDLRVGYVTSDSKLDTYLSGDYGKLSNNQGLGLSIAQLALQYQVDWENNMSGRIVLNGFSDSQSTNVGVTEAFLQYKSLPSATGWRYRAKAGLFYPKISMENVAIGWSSPYTLTSSAINSWVGEELRHSGASLSLEKLGKFAGTSHNFIVDLSVFQNNDTAGAMLAWHGWTMSSRQTLLQEKLIVQNFPAREDKLSMQASRSDPFLELDHRWGTHIVGQWHNGKNIKLNAGFYDNQAKRGLVENGQYTWTTEFMHIGLQVKLPNSLELISQYMEGRTLMTSTILESVVDNDYDSAFLMLRHRAKRHHIALRVEHFSVDDIDTTYGDNNDESGKAFTMSYRYQVSSPNFIVAEFNWIDTDRPSRAYENNNVSLIERQLQLAYRYYF